MWDPCPLYTQTQSVPDRAEGFTVRLANYSQELFFPERCILPHSSCAR